MIRLLYGDVFALPDPFLLITVRCMIETRKSVFDVRILCYFEPIINIIISCSSYLHSRMQPLLDAQTLDKPQFLLISVYSAPHTNITVQNIQNHKFS